MDSWEGPGGRLGVGLRRLALADSVQWKQLGPPELISQEDSHDHSSRRLADPGAELSQRYSGGCLPSRS